MISGYEENQAVMTTSTLERLPADIHDRLLRTLPNTRTLKAAVLSCKAFHDAYELRKKTIQEEVSQNWLREENQWRAQVMKAMMEPMSSRLDKLCARMDALEDLQRELK